MSVSARCTLRVIYGDTDQMGVVYYANYLRWFEAARNEVVRAHGIPYRELEAQGFLLPVVEAYARYRQPARYDDLLEVEAALSPVGRARLRFDYVVSREGQVLCTGHTVHACLGDDGRPTRLPPALVQAFPRAPR